MYVIDPGILAQPKHLPPPPPPHTQPEDPPSPTRGGHFSAPRPKVPKRTAMALVSVAVVGRDNEPLYLRDFGDGPSTADASDGDGDGGEEEEDPFGFLGGGGRSPGESCSQRHTNMVHAGLDRVEELLRAGPLGPWRTPGAVGSANSMWVGLLCTMDDMRLYGYLTNTGIKFLALVEDGRGSPPEEEKATLAREKDLKSLFVILHKLFVEYSMNPFSKLRGKISSRRFDEGLDECVGALNAKHGS